MLKPPYSGRVKSLCQLVELQHAVFQNFLFCRSPEIVNLQAELDRRHFLLYAPDPELRLDV